MKHQYFGDLSDYKKYSILRLLANNGSIKILISWLLTENDNRNDGKRNSYLFQRTKWRWFEPDIFDLLFDSVVTRKNQNLFLVEQNKIIPCAKYYWSTLSDLPNERKKYFDDLSKLTVNMDLVFLDPDNGIAPPSVKIGHKNSSKYIYIDEIMKLWQKELSVLIYQHFPRVNRKEYINKQVLNLIANLPTKIIYAIQTTHMVYFLLLQDKHISEFKTLKSRIEDKWADQIKVYQFEF